MGEWYRQTDNGELSSMDGFYVISNASKSSVVKASSGVVYPSNQTTEVIVERKLSRRLRDYVNILSLYLRLTLYTLTSVFTFSILFSVNLLGAGSIIYPLKPQCWRKGQSV